MQQILSILVENRAGVLTRVASLFARRSYNIDSLAVGETENAAVSRITITLRGDDDLIRQVTRQLHKLPDVLYVRHLARESVFTRELTFIKIRADADSRVQIVQMIDVFRGRVLEVTPTTMTLEMAGKADKIQGLLRLLEPFGILELVRSGPIAIERGESYLSVRAREGDREPASNIRPGGTVDAVTAMPL